MTDYTNIIESVVDTDITLDPEEAIKVAEIATALNVEPEAAYKIWFLTGRAHCVPYRAKFLEATTEEFSYSRGDLVDITLKICEALMGEGTFGVEPLRDENHWDRYYGDCVALYVNTGDTYTPTVLYDTEEDEFFVCSWGDWLEGKEAEKLSEELADEDEDEDEEDWEPQGTLVFSDDTNTSLDAYVEGYDC